MTSEKGGVRAVSEFYLELFFDNIIKFSIPTQPEAPFVTSILFATLIPAHRARPALLTSGEAPENSRNAFRPSDAPRFIMERFE